VAQRPSSVAPRCELAQSVVGSAYVNPVSPHVEVAPVVSRGGKELQYWVVAHGIKVGWVEASAAQKVDNGSPCTVVATRIGGRGYPIWGKEKVR
jgi:hypothetical protein